MRSDPRDYQLSLSSQPEQATEKTDPQTGKSFLGVHFRCCSVYVRIYRGEYGYDGRCPKCCRPVRFRVGSGGTSSRFFVAE